jgi:hypothetical protein
MPTMSPNAARRCYSTAAAPPVHTPRQHDSLGSERGLATPSPDGKGKNISALSLMIMPPDS